MVVLICSSKILSISDTVSKTNPVLLTDTTGVCQSATGSLQAFTVNYSTGAFTYGTAVSISGATIENIVPLTSTTCQWVYVNQNSAGISTRIITSTGGSTAPTLGTALATSITTYATVGNSNIYNLIGYDYKKKRYVK